MRVTIVDSDVAWPANSGKRLRTLNLMLLLAQEHEITYIGRGSGSPEEVEAQAFLADHGVRPIIVEEPLAENKGLRFVGRAAANLADQLPYFVRAYKLPRIMEAVRTHLGRCRPDLCQLEWMAYGDMPMEFGVPTVLQAPNIESLIWKRSVEVETNPLKRAFMREQWRKYIRYEGQAFRRAERVAVVSEADKALAQSLYGDIELDVVENGVDFEHFASVNREPDGRSVLFVGSLDWRPNQDAARLLIEELMPALRRRVPEARAMIVGRRPPAWLVEQIENADCVELCADVPDVRPYLARCAVMAVPLRIGGGSRLKILEALAAQVPVVSTSVGAEGLSLKNGVHIEVADDIEAQAECLAGLIAHPAKARSQAMAGQETVSQRYDWSSISRVLDRVWHEAAAQSGNRSRPALVEE